MKTPISGTITTDERELYNLQQGFFSKLKERTLRSGISSLLTSDDDMTLYSTLNSPIPGHSIMRFSSPASTSNWAVEPLEFKLLGARVRSGFNEDFEVVPRDVEAVDIRGTFDAQGMYFRDFTLVYKSAMGYSPNTYLSYSSFDFDENQEDKPFQINYKVASTPQEVRNYMPHFEKYFTSCIEHFLPISPSHTFKDDQIEQFQKHLLWSFTRKNSFIDKGNKILESGICQGDDIVVANDKLVRNYLGLLKTSSK